MDYKELLKQEYADLRAKYKNLAIFQDSETYQKLSKAQIILLSKQSQIMFEYLNVLEIRCALEGIDLTDI